MLQLAFENLLLRVEFMEKTQPLALALSRGLGHKADELAAHRGDSVTRCFVPDDVVDLAKRHLAEVGNVHRDLRLAMREHPHSFNAGKASTGCTNFAGDGARSGDIGGVQIKIPGDEEAARAHRSCSGSGMKVGTAHIGTAGNLALDSLAQALELALA